MKLPEPLKMVTWKVRRSRAALASASRTTRSINVRISGQLTWGDRSAWESTAVTGKDRSKNHHPGPKGEMLESYPAKGGTGRTIEPGWVPCRFEQTNLKQGGQPASDKVKSTGI